MDGERKGWECVSRARALCLYIYEPVRDSQCGRFTYHLETAANSPLSFSVNAYLSFKKDVKSIENGIVARLCVTLINEMAMIRTMRGH